MFTGGSSGIEATDQALQDSQAALASVFGADATTAFSEQQQILGQQQARLNQMVANPMGYTPEQLHAATTSINENTATAAKQAIGAAASYAAAHGGSDIGGGPIGQEVGQITSGATQSKAQQLSSLSQQNEELKQQNMWKAIGGLQSVGSEFGSATGTTAGAGSSAASTSTGAGTGALNAGQAGIEDVGAILSGVGGLVQAGIGK